MLDTSLEESHWERDTQDTIALQTQNLTCPGGTLLGRATTMGFIVVEPIAISSGNVEQTIITDWTSSGEDSYSRLVFLLIG